LLVCAVAIVMTIAVPAVAQDAAMEQAERALVAAASKHRTALSDLFQTRGLSRPPAPRDVSVDRLRQLLLAHYPTETALLFYDHDGATLHIWLITPREFAYERVRVTRQELSDAIGRLRAALRIGPRQQARIPRRRGLHAMPERDHLPPMDVASAVHGVSGQLFPGAIARGVVSARPTHLVVVPALEIGTIPVALLEPVAGRGPVVEHMSVSLAPSLFDLFQQAPLALRRPDQVLIVGNPAFRDPEWKLPPLPGAAVEARTVAQLFGHHALLGREATWERVMARAPHVDLLYLATHGVAADSQPLEGSFLALAPSKAQPARWTARQIQAARLRAQLVVLSACQTGLGGIHDAGIIGLGRAFQLAGAQQVVMSLWNIDDQATAELMRHFVTALQGSIHVPEALRRAMLVAKHHGASPVQWASFVVFAGPFPHR
jgi:hypothetical protein